MDDSKHPRPAYMIWPKRVVSWIDFIDETTGNFCIYNTIPLAPNPVDPKLTSSAETCTIHPDLKINIGFVTSSVGESYDSQGALLSKTFQNDIIDGLPFGIDICLDYLDADAQRDPYRMAQLDQRNFKIDFILSAGIKLSTSNYANAPYIQYSVHNDGILNSSES